MRARAILPLIALTLGLASCDKIPFIGGKSEPAADSAAVAEAAAADTTTQAAPAPAPAEAAPAPPTPLNDNEPQGPGADPAVLSRSPVALEGEMPWTPTHTGTVNPGMSADDVISTWGEPAAERTIGNLQFLYFRNGCEHRCGTFDLVILEGGQVIDAVVRGPGHTYSGISSSPPNAQPVPNTSNVNGA